MVLQKIPTSTDGLKNALFRLDGHKSELIDSQYSKSINYGKILFYFPPPNTFMTFTRSPWVTLSKYIPLFAAA